MKDKLLIVLGPTACGKTALSVKLAKKFDGEIISGDSMQVYRGMDIGTAKITAAEADGVIHHLLDILDPDEAYTVGDFQEQARVLIKKINARGKLPIIAGGTGLYIDSVIKPYYFPRQTAGDGEVREELLRQLQEKGTAALYTELRDCDPSSAAGIHPNDLQRLLRALEVYRVTGEPISAIRARGEASRDSRDTVILGLTMPRQDLYDRIDSRVDDMMSHGLLDEVKQLLRQGYAPELNSLQGLGYRQLVGYLQDKYPLDEAVYLIKRDTRHFAKRQLTWFKRNDQIKWLDVSNYSGQEDLFNEAVSYIEQAFKEESL